MMMSMEAYVREGRYTLRKLAADPKVQKAARYLLQVLTGFLLSAASLSNQPMPLVLSMICARYGVQSALLAVGGSAGYLVFWGNAGAQCVVWTVLGLIIAGLLGERPLARDTPLLLPAAAAAAVAVSGLVFQSFFGDTTAVGVYLLRIVLAGGGVRIFVLSLERKDPIAQWIATGFGVLALAQVVPVPYLGLGFLAAGMLSSTAAFPAAALAGLALDLARITPMPMTAVTCLCYFLRMLPVRSKYYPCILPPLVYTAAMGICAVWDWTPLPGLAVGGFLGLLYPGETKVSHRRGETGVAQVRLELAAGVLFQTQQLLLELPVHPVDDNALLLKAAERACGSCPCRKTCREREAAAKLPARILYSPLLEPQELGISCRKAGRLLYELRRGQEQLRAMQADRRRQQEYREALVQQYQFVGQFVRELSDTLSQRIREPRVRYEARVGVYGNRAEAENGDKCVHFAGTGGKYYVLLCDGMGQGMGASHEAAAAVDMLRKLLRAGFPAEHALRSLNSLYALRGAAGAVTVDLAQLELDSGRAAVYKWGAAPSLLVTQTGAQRIGAATPPPGLSVADSRETVDRLSLRRGETLLLLSDGIGTEDARSRLCAGAQPEKMAENLLAQQGEGRTDDATIAAIRLFPVA